MVKLLIISHIASRVIFTTHSSQCVSNFFTLQPLHVKYQYNCTYQANPVTKLLIDRLSIHVLLDEPIIINLPAAYRTTISRNLLRLLEIDLCIMNSFQLLLNIFFILLYQLPSATKQLI